MIGWPGAVEAAEIPGLFVTAGFGAESLAELVPLAQRINSRYDDRLGGLAKAMACSLHNAATYALAEQPWEFAAVHYDALAYCSVHFAESLTPRMAHVSLADQEIYGDLLPAVYRFHDMLLGTLLDLAGAETAVLLVAPFGYASGSDRPHKNSTRFSDHSSWVTRTGLLCLRAPSVLGEESAALHRFWRVFT